MRKPILVLCILATPGLCGGGVCGVLVIDHDEFLLSTVAGALAWLALLGVWIGVALLGGRAKRAGVWCLVTGALLSWASFALGIAVCVTIARGYSWMSPVLPVTLWVIVTWNLGVLPATLAAGRSWRARGDTSRLQKPQG